MKLRPTTKESNKKPITAARPSVRSVYDSFNKPPKNTGEKKKSYKLANFMILIAMILGIIFLIYYNPSLQDEDIALEVPSEKPDSEVIEKIPMTSFTQYLNNSDIYIDRRIRLTGFLYREIERSGSGGVYVESVIDGFGNKIKLLNLNKEQIALFPNTGKTDELYEVSGRFRKKYQGLDLEVTNILDVKDLSNYLKK